MAKNPPAFPIPNATDLDGYVYAPEASGMMLRDYFAGQALPAVIADATHGGIPDGTGTIYDMLSQSAYRFADAMLAERERGQ